MIMIFVGYDFCRLNKKKTQFSHYILLVDALSILQACLCAVRTRIFKSFSAVSWDHYVPYDTIAMVGSHMTIRAKYANNLWQAIVCLKDICVQPLLHRGDRDRWAPRRVTVATEIRKWIVSYYPMQAIKLSRLYLNWVKRVTCIRWKDGQWGWNWVVVVGRMWGWRSYLHERTSFAKVDVCNWWSAIVLCVSK